MNQKDLLLIEDNPDDVFLMRRALQKTGFEFPLHVVSDGQQALNYLAGEDEFADRDTYPIPSLILLDLKLPYLSGFEVLEWIRDNPALQQVEVVILTSSAEDRDQRRARELSVATYLVKPPRPETLKPILQRLIHIGPAPRELLES